MLEQPSSCDSELKPSKQAVRYCQAVTESDWWLLAAGRCMSLIRLSGHTDGSEWNAHQGFYKIPFFLLLLFLPLLLPSSATSFALGVGTHLQLFTLLVPTKHPFAPTMGAQEYQPPAELLSVAEVSNCLLIPVSCFLPICCFLYSPAHRIESEPSNSREVL